MLEQELEKAGDIQKKTCTTIFLLPGIGLKRQNLLKHGFISAYLDDKDHEVHYENAVYLLYKPSQVQEFQKFLTSEYKRTPLLVEDYDYPGGYIVTVYKFPAEFMEEYELFLRGKYSKFRKKYIELFPMKVEMLNPANHMYTEKLSLQYHIFERTDALRKYWEDRLGYRSGELPENLEYWSIPEKEKETLDINAL